VNVNDVYAQYSNGVFDPKAIKDYIAYAEHNLGTQYVLLVGGDTYDYRNYSGVNSQSFIPSIYVKTGTYDTFVPADSVFADTDNDKAPEVAIGRFPVRTMNELNWMIQKTLAYQNKANVDAAYAHNAVFVADKFDGTVSFKTHSISMSSTMPGNWTQSSIYLDNTSTADASTQLLAALNNGSALVTFTGHSGPGQWTFPSVFNTGLASTLTNAGKPFVTVQWGCWDNYYVDPQYNYLVQSLLLANDHGAAATLGAVTRADSESEMALSQVLMPRLLTPGMTLGQALQFAKADVAASNPSLIDVLYGYTLMGDPALMVEP
jgi:hypothetical protein